MAIKISGTTVIDDSRNLTNIGTIKGIDYPATDGSAGQALITDGAGSLSLQDPVRPGPQVDAVASGTLPDGSPVVVNSDGTVSGVGPVPKAEELGTETLITVGGVKRPYDSAFDTSAGKFVIVYKDDDNSGFSTVVTGTVDGNSISFGTPVVYSSSFSPAQTISYHSVENKIVIAYQDTTNNNYATAIVGTLSGDSVNLGTPVAFNSNSLAPAVNIYDSVNEKIIVAVTMNYSTNCFVGTVSGTSISFGSGTSITDGPAEPAGTYDPAAGKVIIAYRNNFDDDNGTAIVGTVSGTSISFGTPVVFNSEGGSGSTRAISLVYDSVTSKIVIAYDSNSTFPSFARGTAIVGTVSGTSISFGTSVIYDSNNTDTTSAVYDPAAGKVIIAYRDEDASDIGKIVSGTVSGNSITFDTPLVFNNDGFIAPITAVYDPNSLKTVVSYFNGGDSNGESITYNPDTTVPNLTSENFIGFSDAAYSDSQTATIQIIGSTNTDQSGLTTGQLYFVQTDGSLAETPDDPEVFAGTALSNTDLLIKF